MQSLYRGLTPNLLGNASSWGIFFYWKSLAETSLSAYHHGATSSSSSPSSSFAAQSLEARNQHILSPFDYFLASGAAGLLTAVTTNPIWVLKTRMLSSSRGAHGAYTSLWAGVRDVAQKEGWRGFYRGLGASCIGVSHGAVQFGIYEPLKAAWRRYAGRANSTGRGGEREKVGNTATIVMSGVSKVLAGTATYPYQVVRSRLQTYNADVIYGRGIREVVSRVWKADGWRGFYRGLGPNVVRVLPATWVTFLVYENVRFYAGGWQR